MRLTVIGTGYLGAIHAAAWRTSDTRSSASTSTAGRSRRSRRPGSRSSSPACRSCCAGAPRGRPAAFHHLARRRPPTSATCTSSASAPRSARTRYAADLQPRRRGRRRPGAAPAPAQPRRRQVDRPGRHRRGRWTAAARGAARARRRRRRARLEPGVPARGLRRPGHPAPRPAGRSASPRRAPSRLLRRSTPRCSRAGVAVRSVTDLATAELVKVAANSFLATKISFINAMAEVCDAAGADVVDPRRRPRPRRAHRPPVPVRRASGSAAAACPRTSAPSCARAERARGRRRGRFLREVDEINMRRGSAPSTWPASCSAARSPGSGSRVLGAAFKPDSDDVRDSPALDVAAEIARRRAPRSRVHDPRGASTTPARALPDAGLRRRTSLEACRATPTWCCT